MDLKDIFNHQKTDNPEKDPHLYDWRRPFRGKNDAAYLNKLLKSKSNKKYQNRYSSSKTRTSGFESNKKQRVVFKMSYGNSLPKHKRYVKLYMPQIGKDGIKEEKEIFGTDINEYQEHLSPLHFKFIISPESQQVDLRQLSETFIKHLEELTGYKFYWLGVEHTDTEHHHAHLSINGIDKNGKKVRFPKDMIKDTMRGILSNITTNMIGERTAEEIEDAKRHQTMAKRWTRYDEQLQMMPEKIYIKTLNNSLTSRILFLTSIGLAKKENMFYTLSPDFEEVLKATGRYNLYLEEYLKSDLPLKLFEGGSITGKVDKIISFDKDESWNDAIIIRTKSERLYIPVFQLHKENLEGKIIRIENAAGGTNRNISDKDIQIIKTEQRNISLTR